MAFDECPPVIPITNMPKSLDSPKNGLNVAFNDSTAPNPFTGMAKPYSRLFRVACTPTSGCVRLKMYKKHNRDGYAIGGLSVGEPTDVMYQMVEVVNGILPKSKPRYLMGVGTPENILESIALGIDMFDCVMPTRNGRNGMLFTSEGIINIRNKKWQTDFSPIDPFGPTFVDNKYTKSIPKAPVHSRGDVRPSDSQHSQPRILPMVDERGS